MKQFSWSNALGSITLLVSSLLISPVAIAQQSTLDKMKSTGVVTMGVRESSGALSYTLGDGKYAGRHISHLPRYTRGRQMTRVHP